MDISLKDCLENKDNKFLFHGSTLKLDVLKPMQANDANGTKANIDTAVFLSSSFLGAVPYAFMDTIKANSKGLNWSFSVSSENGSVKMVMKNVRIDENIDGFVYVFERTADMVNDPKGSTQFKSYNEIKPLCVIKVNYKDYSNYFVVEEPDSTLGRENSH